MYIWYMLVPSVILLLIIAGYALSSMKRLANRLITGLWAGAVATIGLEVFRLSSVAMRWLPGDDMIAFPGALLTGRDMMGAMMLMSFKAPAPLVVLVAGAAYHFFNGATFGAVYAMVMGKAKWIYGLIWGVVIEVGMMLAPWLVMMMGPFGVRYAAGYQIFVASLLAHIAYGVILGLLVQRYVKERGSILALIKAPRAT